MLKKNFNSNLNALKETQLEIYHHLKEANIDKNHQIVPQSVDHIPAYHNSLTSDPKELILFIGCSGSMVNKIYKFLNKTIYYKIQTPDYCRSYYKIGSIPHIEIDDKLFKCEPIRDGLTNISINSQLFIYEKNILDLVTLFTTTDIADHIRSGRIQFFVGKKGAVHLTELLFPCFNQVSKYISKNQMDFFKHFIQKKILNLNEEWYYNHDGNTDWYLEESVDIPEICRAGKGGRWLFLIKIPNYLTLFNLYIDIKKVLERNHTKVFHLFVLPNCPSAYIAEKIRLFNPDNVCDLMSMNNYNSINENEYMLFPVNSESSIVKLKKTNIPWC